jgi:phage gp29-like protein
MPRKSNPLSQRNRNKSYKPHELLDAIAEAVTLGASKRAQKTRTSDEFDLERLMRRLRAPMATPSAFSWTIEQIAAARDAQMRGQFRQAAPLVASMRSDDAIFVPRRIRLDTDGAVPVKVEPASKNATAQSIAREAEALYGSGGLALSQLQLASVRADLVDHGIAYGCISEWRPRDGARWDPIVEYWPIEHVWWNSALEEYQTQTREGVETIRHGNGRWIVFAKSSYLPFREDACLLPAALVWARHAFANRDWLRGSATHGNAKVVGALPEGMQLTAAGGALTEEAAAFLDLLVAIAGQDSPVGIKPQGSAIDYLVNSSRAWEVWAKLSDNAERAAARIYLGTDGILGAVGGAPGVDIKALFGVSSPKFQGDFTAVSRAIQEGVIAPWTAINFGDSSLAPTRYYEFPDPDKSKFAEDLGLRIAAFNAAVAGYKSNGFDVTADLVADLASSFDVPLAMLAPVATPAAPESPNIGTTPAV